jgi:hypothetical protein
VPPDWRAVTCLYTGVSHFRHVVIVLFISHSNAGYPLLQSIYQIPFRRNGTPIPEGMNLVDRQRRWKWPIAERARRSVMAVARRHFLAIAAVALAVALGVGLAPR